MYTKMTKLQNCKVKFFYSISSKLKFFTIFENNHFNVHFRNRAEVDEENVIRRIYC